MKLSFLLKTKNGYIIIKVTLITANIIECLVCVSVIYMHSITIDVINLIR